MRASFIHSSFFIRQTSEKSLFDGWKRLIHGNDEKLNPKKQMNCYYLSPLQTSEVYQTSFPEGLLSPSLSSVHESNVSNTSGMEKESDRKVGQPLKGATKSCKLRIDGEDICCQKFWLEREKRKVWTELKWISNHMSMAKGDGTAINPPTLSYITCVPGKCLSYDTSTTLDSLTCEHGKDVKMDGKSRTSKNYWRREGRESVTRLTHSSGWRKEWRDFNFCKEIRIWREMMKKRVEYEEWKRNGEKIEGGMKRGK